MLILGVKTINQIQTYNFLGFPSSRVLQTSERYNLLKFEIVFLFK